jgi:hypothetical protein
VSLEVATDAIPKSLVGEAISKNPSILFSFCPNLDRQVIVELLLILTLAHFRLD